MFNVKAAIAACIPVSACLIQPVWAGDISHGLRHGPENESNYFALGVAAGCGRGIKATLDEDDKPEGCGLGWFLGGAYKWKGLFIELHQPNASGINLGYTLWEDANWQLDIIALNAKGHNSDIQVVESDTEEQRNNALLKRESSQVNAGIRLTRHWQNSMLEFSAGSDYQSDRAGPYIKALGGRFWQVKNWNFHALGGLHWDSKRLNHYLWGVDSTNATERFEAYEADSALSMTLELGATYPITEHWVSKTQAGIFLPGSDVTDSPLVVNNSAYGISTSLSYVF